MSFACAVTLGMLSGCGSGSQMRARVPETHMSPPQQPDPVVQGEEAERWMSCAAGGVKSLIREGKLNNLNVAVYPIINRTGERNLQLAIDLEAAHAVRQMGLNPYLVSVASHPAQVLAMTPAFVIQTEISVIDRVISAAEAEKEFGLTFGKGGGAGAIGSPSQQKVSHGRIRAITTVEVFTENKASRAINRMVSNTHASSANLLSRTTAEGTDFFMLFRYGDALTVREVAGAQRALLAAARASLAGAILKKHGIQPAICGI